MSTDSSRKPIPVSLPVGVVEELDELVEEGVFSSRSEALRYGARLVVREERDRIRLHEVTDAVAERDIRERLERKRQA
ncbi:MAG: ribbon-helix-helix protein, CopG family [Halodesulfurarchaeum sp.]|nr:ribbon-helix-helix protein, CopG family [Halodesulfurarchaeum sp.]